MTKLSDTQTILLSTASQRDSGSVYPLPGKVSAPRAAKALALLIAAGFAEERETDVAAHVSRTDGDVRYGVYVTPAGLAGIAVEDGASADLASADVEPPTPAKRETKASAVLALLSRGGGATLAELIAATGWLPHTTRAALTGLRKKGHAIERGKRGEDTCYSLVAA